MYSHSQSTVAAPGWSAISKTLQVVSALLLGIIIVYGAGFVQAPAVHSAAHDMRHATGFPCH